MSENEGTETEADVGEDGPGESTEAPAGDPIEMERDRFKEQLLRTAADFDNFRKRARRDIEDASKRSKEQTLLEVLPLVDNLERAVQASESAADVTAVVDGVRMVLRSFNDIAERVGLERVEAVGARFDPNLHDAVQQMETAEYEPGTIVAEVMSGYRLGEKLIRPAMVVVARPPSEPSED